MTDNEHDRPPLFLVFKVRITMPEEQDFPVGWLSSVLNATVNAMRKLGIKIEASSCLVDRETQDEREKRISLKHIKEG